MTSNQPIEQFIEAMNSASPKALRLANKQLDSVEEESRERFITEALKTLEPKTRCRIILRLCELGRKEAVRPLISFLRTDESEVVRISSSVALRWICDASALQGLAEALGDASEKVRISACVAIKEIVLSKIEHPLFGLLERGSWNCRLYAAATLLALKVKDERILHVLEELADQPERAEHDRDIEHSRELEAKFDVPASDPTQAGAYRPMDEILAEARRLFAPATETGNGE